MVNDSKKVDVEKDIVKVNKLNIDDAFTALTLKYKNLQKKIEKALSAFNVKQQEKRRVLSEEKTKRRQHRRKRSNRRRSVSRQTFKSRRLSLNRRRK